MRRWHVTASSASSLAIVGPMGCALNTSPGEQARTSQTFTQVSAFLTAVDVDVLDDHVLITLQSDVPLRYAVRHDETSPRPVVDLPAHRIAPGVRPLEVFQGGVTRVHPQQRADPAGARLKSVFSQASSTPGHRPPPAPSVENRFDASRHTRPTTDAGLRAKGRIPGAGSADRPAIPPNGKAAFTLWPTTPGNAGARHGGDRHRC